MRPVLIGSEAGSSAIGLDPVPHIDTTLRRGLRCFFLIPKEALAGGSGPGQGIGPRHTGAQNNARFPIADYLTNVRSGGVEIQRVQISLECSGAQAAEEREKIRG